MPTEERFRQLMDAAPVMIWCADAAQRCIYVNKVWLDFTGRTMEQEIGCGWLAGVHADDEARLAALYAKHFNQRRPFRVEYRLLRHDGTWGWLLATGVPRFEEAAFIGFIGCCTDITDLKEAAQQRQRDLEEKAALLQELHHRVKNNAQVFASLLTIQASRAAEPVVEAALHIASARASALAITQQQIYDAGSSAQFDLGNFARRLAQARGPVSTAHVEVEVKTPRTVLVPLSTAVPLGLILNELLSNAVRHAFPDGRAGLIEVALWREDDGRLCVTVHDDGVGLPAGATLDGQRSAGLTIVKSLSRQLGASLTLESLQGTRVCLALPVPAYPG